MIGHEGMSCYKNQRQENHRFGWGHVESAVLQSTCWPHLRVEDGLVPVGEVAGVDALKDVAGVVHALHVVRVLAVDAGGVGIDGEDAQTAASVASDAVVAIPTTHSREWGGKQTETSVGMHTDIHADTLAWKNEQLLRLGIDEVHRNIRRNKVLIGTGKINQNRQK